MQVRANDAIQGWEDGRIGRAAAESYIADSGMFSVKVTSTRGF